MLRVAVPNKGALSEKANAMLREAGYRTRSDSKDLTVVDVAHGVEFFYLRPKDIAVYVGSGELDMGITGRDLAEDSLAPVRERLALRFGRSKFRWAARSGEGWSLEKLDGKRIAAAYPNLVRKELAKHGMSAEVIRLDGAVEISIQLGLADAIADIVESGRTLRNHGLEPFGEPLCVSEAVLIEREGSDASDPARAQLAARLQGIVFAQQYMMLDYDCPKDVLAEVTAITPGVEAPTISPLTDPDWVAVRALVESHGINDIMDQLRAAGARAILASEIRNCRM